MESLKDVLNLTLKIRASLESGEALRSGLTQYLSKTSSPFASKLKEWLFMIDQTGRNRAQSYFERHCTLILLDIVVDGLQGRAIHERLLGFEDELIDIMENEIQKKMDSLPYILMLPLLFFMFPAYLILILGPILNQFLKTM